ncbi:MAG: hypothetical protein ACMZI2_02645 [Candidatus Symbiodolus clandestinus]
MATIRLFSPHSQTYREVVIPDYPFRLQMPSSQSLTCQCNANASN